MNDFVLNGPFEEVELSDGGFDVKIVFVRERYALPSTERVESGFRIRLEFEFIIVVNLEASVVMVVVSSEVFFGVVGNEPVK